jgi:acyl-coenzyme A thioesterase PaaI-like protein
VEAVTDGAFRETISDRWNALGDRPNCGYLLAVALQALGRVLPFPDPLTVAAFYLRPTAPGPAEIGTEIARVGRRVATGEARLVQGGGYHEEDFEVWDSRGTLVAQSRQLARLSSA